MMRRAVALTLAALGVLITVLRLTSAGGASPIVRAAALDQQPIDVLVDGRSGHAFVLAADGPAGIFPQNSPDPHGNGHVQVFDTATGALLHVEDAGYRPCAIVAAEHAGRVFVAYGDAVAGAGALLMLDATSGRRLSVMRTGPAPCGGAPVLDQRRDHVFFVSSDESLDTVDAHGGQLLETARVPSANGISVGDTGLAVDEQAGRVFAALPNSGAVDVFDAEGRHLRTVARGSGDPLLGLALDPRYGHLFVVNGATSTVSMLDTRTAAVRQVVAVAAHPTAWALGGGRLVVGGDTALSIVDARTGTVVHTVQLGDQAVQILVDGRLGRAFVLGADGLGVTPDVYVVDLRAGRLAGTIRLPGVPLSAALDGRHDRLVIADQGGGIDVIDARGGRLVHVYRGVPSTLAMVAIDASRGRAVVVRGRGIVAVPDTWAWLPTWLRAAMPFLPRPGTSYRDAPAGLTVVDDTR